MVPILTPLLHGEVGFWDEILCLIPSLALLALMAYFYLRQRRQGSGPARISDPESGDREPSPRE